MIVSKGTKGKLYPKAPKIIEPGKLQLSRNSDKIIDTLANIKMTYGSYFEVHIVKFGFALDNF
jgi:hypothetical protein